MLKDKIVDLINKDEDVYHDFKEEWYSPYKKDEMIKDIFSFLNTVHHQDCYIIIGVRDKDHKIVGVEEDENRLNTEKLTDYFNNLPISNSYRPQLFVKNVRIESHLIDVIIIKDTNNVPIFLDKEYHPKRAEHHIHPGQVFTRLNSVETAIDSTAKYYEVEELWKKHFGLDLSIQERYKVKLKDISNWDYFENDKAGFLYNPDPDYCIFISNDEVRNYQVESYSLSQSRVRIDWGYLKLMHKDRLIQKIPMGWLDQGRFITVDPKIDALNQASPEEMLVFRCLYADSFEFLVEDLLLSNESHAISSSYLQRKKLLDNIVLFRDRTQRDNLVRMLQDRIEKIQEIVKPTESQLKQMRSKISFDFSQRDTEYYCQNLEKICMEQNTSQYINNFINQETDMFRPRLLF